MKNINILMSAFILSLMIGFTSCSDDDEIIQSIELGTLDMQFTNLPNLGNDYVYEGWIIVDGAPKTAGIFTVDDNGNPSQSSFDLNAADLGKATAYALTIEPAVGDDPAPSDVHILAGDFTNGSSLLDTEHPLAIGTDFLDASGSYLLGTPTDGALDTDERSGIWWEDMSSGTAQVSLDLPTLPKGWVYEGWVVVDGQPLTTGKFIEVDMPDFAAPFSGTAPGPPFPGEDFIVNAPNGLSFPLDLSGSITAITVEPSPDNGPGPFSMKPLIHMIPDNAQIHTGYQMDNGASDSNPSGQINIKL